MIVICGVVRLNPARRGDAIKAALVMVAQ